MIMEIRIHMDEAQMRRAQELTGLTDPQQLIPHVLAQFVQMEAMARIARLRGADPTATLPSHRRPELPGSGDATGLD